jgi:hypothetical protein
MRCGGIKGRVGSNLNLDVDGISIYCTATLDSRLRELQKVADVWISTTFPRFTVGDRERPLLEHYQ